MNGLTERTLDIEVAPSALRNEATYLVRSRLGILYLAHEVGTIDGNEITIYAPLARETIDKLRTGQMSPIEAFPEANGPVMTVSHGACGGHHQTIIGHAPVASLPELWLAGLRGRALPAAA